MLLNSSRLFQFLVMTSDQQTLLQMNMMWSALLLIESKYAML